MNKIFTYISNNSLILLISLIFLIEFLATLYLGFTLNPKTRLVGIYKVIFIILLGFYFRPSKLNKYYLYLLIVPLLLFLINQFLLNPILKENLKSNIFKGSIYYCYKFIYIFVFIIIFNTIENRKIVAIKSLKIIEYILFLNAFLIVIGSFLDIELLASYSNSNRFGSDGLFNKVNEVSYLYMIYIGSLYLNYIRSKSGLLKLIFIVFISFLLGTKTIILFLALLLIGHIFIVANVNRKLKLIMGLILTFIIIYFKKIALFYFKIVPFWNKLLDDYSIISLLFSKRDLLLEKNLNYIDNNWQNLNYLIGGSYYTSKFEITQMDGPDLFLFFGLVGLIVYLILFFKVFLIREEKIIYNLVLFIIFICGILSGGLLLSVMATVYLYLLKIKMQNRNLNYD
ncbi:hypothetical protein [Mesoflavibacter zeaxanthinifaciens]|uniref:hypothetical protein n=1 Tax=Mesoflavibacter zeaxanthinifaciens TaxID=393060 RepID=UPI0026EF2502|nr:hypothetical protein [Mesoflavibacter zeaxanthinifaciens]